MSTYKEALHEIQKLGREGQLGNTKNVIDYLDRLIKNGDDEIKTFTQANLPCPVQPTCLGTIEAIARCGTGISGNIKVKSTLKCPVSIGVTRRNNVAQKNPTGVFTDQSLTVGHTRACVVLTPELQSVVYDVDVMTDECNTCGDFTTSLTTSMATSVFLGTEQDLITTFAASAGANLTLSGNILARLQAIVKVVKNAERTNQNKIVTIYCNQAVIDELSTLLDSTGKPLGNYKDECPLTSCDTFCFNKLKLVGVDATVLPIIAGATTIYAVVDDNVFRSASAIEIKTKSWDQTLTDMDNRQVAYNFVTSRIDAAMFPQSVKAAIITI